jgi:hypothetical protein
MPERESKREQGKEKRTYKDYSKIREREEKRHKERKTQKKKREIEQQR